MENLCSQFWFCNAVPPEWHWVMAIVMPLLFIILIGVPVASVLHRAGRSRWWTVIAFVPFLNLSACGSSLSAAGPRSTNHRAKSALRSAVHTHPLAAARTLQRNRA